MNVLRDFFFFWKKENFCVSFSSWAENCHTLAMNLQSTVKMRFFCLEVLFQGDGLFSEKKIKKLVFPIKKWREPFKNYITMIFWQKIPARLHNWIPRLQRDSLRIFLPEKNQLQNCFRNLSGSSLCFVEKIRQIRENCITASRWICWTKHVFVEK